MIQPFHSAVARKRADAGGNDLVTGSNLTTLSGFTHYLYDDVNPFTADSVWRVLVITGGPGFTPGAYRINGITVGYGGHNIIDLLPSDPAPLDSTGGEWHYEIGVTDGDGSFGTNLTALNSPAGYYYDPDSPISSDMRGAILRVSGGVGFTPGDYTVTDYNPDYGGLELAYLGSISTGYAYGASWEKIYGDVIPTPAVNSGFTGAIKLLLIGDSITANQGSTTAAALSAQYPNAASVAVLNHGVGGSRSTNWLIGDASNNLNTAIAAANTAGVTTASIMLGSNDFGDGMSQATHIANIQAIRNSLFANVPTLTKVVLQEQPWAVGDDSLLHSYFTAYNTVAGAIQGASSAATNFAFFEANPQMLSGGLHPHAAALGQVNYSWLLGLVGNL